MMKVTVLMGRGIEGTGNTKYAVEFQEYLENRGDDVVTFADNSKKWGREKSHPNKIRLINFMDNYDSILNRCLSSDLVIVLSVPAKNYDFFACDTFYNIIESLENKVKTVYIQVDHKMQSINRNFYSDEMFEDVLSMFDLIITHSSKCDFVRFCDERFIKIKKLLAADSIGISEIFGINFDKYNDIVKPYTEKDYRTIKFLGRSAGWKGPWLVRDIHNKYLKNQGYITSLEGIEGSIGTVSELYKETKPERIPRDDVSIHMSTNDKILLDSNKFEFKRNSPVYVLPPYDNTKGIERLSKSQFGIELLLLEDKIISNCYEYAMLEMFAVGVIPIFRKRWGELFKVDNKPMIEHDCGVVFMDENNPNDVIHLMNALSDNLDMYNEYQHKARDFAKKHFDSKVIFDKIMEVIYEN